MIKNIVYKKYCILIGLLSVQFSLLPFYFTKVLKAAPTVSAAACITSKEIKKLLTEQHPTTSHSLPSSNTFLFSSLFVHGNKTEQEYCETTVKGVIENLSKEGQRCKKDSATCAKAQMFLAHFSYHPALTNARKNLMVAITGNGKFTEGKEYHKDLKNDPVFMEASSMRAGNRLPARPGEDEEDRPAILIYYMRELLTHNVCGTSIHEDFQKEFTALRERWKEAPHDSVMKLALKDGKFVVTSLAPKQGENCYGARTQQDFVMETTPAFRHLFDTLTHSTDNEVYINRKDLSKFFADQMTAEELFVKRNLNTTYSKLHGFLNDLRSTGTTDFRSLHSLVQDDKTLLSDEDKDFIRSAARNTLETKITQQDLNYDDLSALVLLTTSKYKEALPALDKTLVRLLQPDAIIPNDIRQFLFEHVRLASLPVETPGYAPIAQTLGKLHEIASAGIKHYLIPLPTAEKPLTVSGKPDRKRTRKDCTETRKTHYYTTNESSPIEITLRDNGTCRVVKTVATKFAMKYHLPTAEYPETRNCLTHRSDDDLWKIIGYYEIGAQPTDVEVLEWNLGTAESDILKNLMGLETEKTVVTTSTNIQLFLEGFYHGLSGSTKKTPAEDYIRKLQSTDFNCGRSFIYEKEGHCKNERYPSAF